jgi:copper chaperone
MKTLKYKTNINCGNCVAKVKPFLDGHQNVSHWEVDTQTPDKILTVQGKDLRSQEVEKLIKEAGFEVKAGPLPEKGGQGFLGKLFG